MKKILKSIFSLALAAFIISCADDSLDPYQINKIQKGKLLALRGTQLSNIYDDGVPGAEFFPKAITGTEKFEFDAEYLSEDPTTLESFDIYIIKKTKVGNTTTRERIFMMNVPFSEFQTTDDYIRPWVSVSMDLEDILGKIGITYPLDQTEIDLLLDTYKSGVNIESDLNLTDGTKVLAAQIVSSSLFASDQFYPAQKLTYAVTDYCLYEADSWAATYDATELSEIYGSYGPYDAALIQDGVDPNKYTTDNWYDSGIAMYMVFSPSTNVATQIVTVPSQPNPNNPARTIVGSGTYNQCTGELKISITYTQGATVLDKLVWKLVKQ
ncbi:MAG: hypothetical protein ABI663_15100 [Chryseolinea sp.]